jgi:hypothetical protein
MLLTIQAGGASGKFPRKAAFFFACLERIEKPVLRAQVEALFYTLAKAARRHDLPVSRVNPPLNCRLTAT